MADAVFSPPKVVTRVNYYTARVSGNPDRDAPKRQEAYLDALSTVPEVSIHYGKFLSSEKWAALVWPAQAKPAGYVWPGTLPELVKVQKTEEKGSDVNLGCHLVRDALTDAFDLAVIITNDTDLVEPMRIAIHEAGKAVGLLSPIKQGRGSDGKWYGPHRSLTNAASFTLYLHNSHLANSQFPGAVGKSTRPITWT
ncbi:MAG: hypothetical protein NVS2B5_05870 [Beijerinckiaceae bacterium]